MEKENCVFCDAPKNDVGFVIGSQYICYGCLLELRRAMFNGVDAD
ncbi:hypothetical protein M0R72_12280 [Candidatus Pacearchaeota archaeon]|nr:hypothetical protein [Candidatus Pacearchaeota archaeon]